MPRRALGAVLPWVLALGVAGLARGQAPDSPAPDPEASRAAYAEGAAAYRAGRWRDAEAAHRRALALWPDHAGALNDLAWLLLTSEDEGQRRPDEALPLAERAVALAGERHEYLDTLALALDAAGRPLEGARTALEAVRRAPRADYAERLCAFAARAAEGARAAGDDGARPTAPPGVRAEALGLLAWGHAVRALAAQGDAAAEGHRAALAAADEALAAHAAARGAGAQDAPAPDAREPEPAPGAEAPAPASGVAASPGRADVPALAARAAALLALGAEAGGAGPEAAVAASGAALAAGADALWPDLWRRHGEALRALGRAAEAAAALDEAAARRTADHALQRDVARAWADLPDPDRAQAAVDRAVAALAAHPPVWPTRDAHALHLLAAGAHEAALARLRAGLADDAPDPPAAAERRRAARDALVRAAAVWAADGRLDPRIVAHTARLEGRASADPAEPLHHLRARLAAEVLGQEGVARFRDATGDLLPAGVRGHRVALVDVTGDGAPDLLVAGTRLFVNDGAGRLVPREVLGLTGVGGVGGVLADLDRDGDLDLFVLGHGPGGDRLFRNDSTPGDVRFVDITEAAGVPGGVRDDHPTEGAAWGDLDGDGWPDLYVANYERPGEPLGRATPDGLYLSDGRGGLRDASALLGGVALRCGRGVVLADLDGRGRAAAYVGNYRLQANALWVHAGRGADGAEALRDEGPRRGVAGTNVRGAYGHTIGVTAGDLDLDGRLDLVVGNLAHPQWIEFSDATRLYLQGADGRFRDVRAAAGVAFEETHSNPTLLDVDDDGDLDLLLTATYAGRPTQLWRNRRVEAGALAFEDVTWGASLRGFDGWGSATADVDGDGRQDLVVCEGARVRLLVNEGPASQAPGADGGSPEARSVRVRLVGARGDTWGAGATATLRTPDGLALTRQVLLGEGTGCQSEPVLHFGVGARAGPFALEVRWPAVGTDGPRTSEASLGPGRHEVREPEAPAAGEGAGAR